MMDSGDNLEIARLVISSNWDLMLRRGVTAVVGQMEDRLGF